MGADGKKRWPLAEAQLIAVEITQRLASFCERLEIAGSIRRRKATVGDIEILYVARTGLRTVAPELFPRQHDLVALELDALLRAAVITKRANVNGGFSWGEKNKLGVHVSSGVPVDFFAATEANWFNYLVCRTGGAANNMQIATAAIDHGWKWNPYGPGFSRAAGLGRDTHAVKSEADVFAHVGLPYREPWERE